MDLAAKVAKLEQAQGDPTKLALAAVDIFLDSRDEPWLREALEAAAIPHWFNVEILGKLLGVDEATSERFIAGLKELPFVERFEARGGWNVHEATRLALRSEWAADRTARFLELSARAVELFGGEEPQQQVERVYHRLIANPVEGEKALYELWKKWEDAGRSEPLQALAAALSELLKNEPPLQPVARARALLCLGFIQRKRFPSSEVERLARESLAWYAATVDRQADMDARDLLGDSLFSQGRHQEALREYREYKRIALDLTKRDPGSAGWQRELSVAHTKVGRVLEAEGRRQEALREYEESKRIFLDLARRDPGNIGWLRDLSVSRNDIGRVLEAEGRRKEALRECQESIRIALDLTKRDAGNTRWLRDLAVSHSNVGRVLEAEGRRAEALREYQESKRIMLDLTKRDPGNTGWLGDLSMSYNNVGDVLTAEGRHKAALREYEESKRIALDLTKRDAGNTEWLRGLSVSHNNLGCILEAEGRSEEALRECQEFNRLMLDLTKRDPGNAGWLRELSLSHNNVGGLLEAAGRREEALREYEESKRIMLDLTKRDPFNTGWLLDLSLSHNAIGSLLAQSSETLAEALTEHKHSLALAERLAQIDPANREWADLPAACRAWVSELRRQIDERTKQSSASA